MGRFLVGCGLALVLGLVGCGDSDSDDEDDDDGPSGGTGGSGGAIPLEQLPTRLAEATCRQLYSCCSEAERALDPFVGSTEAECRTNIAALFTLIIPSLSASVNGGRARYDGDAFARCLDAFEAAGCNPASADPLVCESWIVPLVPSGGACGQDLECIDTTCLGESGEAGLTDGTCSAPLPLGSACTDDEDCANGYCLDTCEPKLADGESCIFDEECQSDYCDVVTYVCAPDSNDICG